MLYYVKLKKHPEEPLVAKNVGLLFGTFPYISTAWQFFDFKLFNGFFEKGNSSHFMEVICEGKREMGRLLDDVINKSFVSMSAPPEEVSNTPRKKSLKKQKSVNF